MERFQECKADQESACKEKVLIQQRLQKKHGKGTWQNNPELATDHDVVALKLLDERIQQITKRTKQNMNAVRQYKAEVQLLKDAIASVAHSHKQSTFYNQNQSNADAKQPPRKVKSVRKLPKDAKQERRGPAFLYEGFDHSRKEEVYRHPDLQDKKTISGKWFEKFTTTGQLEGSTNTNIPKNLQQWRDIEETRSTWKTHDGKVKDILAWAPV
eukprot:Tamp_11932.p3 GENE.Tamp_11932~~Tamp_11932.p3  ORF type:complete len:213 (-),score=46.90 Tamp_11932:182-820(-)